MTIRDVLVCLFGAVSGKNEKKIIGICDHGSLLLLLLFFFFLSFAAKEGREMGQ